MSERTAELWAQASESEESPAELESELSELNEAIGWDREVFDPDASTEPSRLSADD